MSLIRSKRRVVLATAVVILLLFLIRPGAQQLRSRIVQSLSLAVGRQVDVSAVRIRLLPQPGFDLEDMVVHDDSSFSAEPMLRSSEVTAYLRLGSLIRGRLEIARLVITEPSLNLVRNNQGHWNLENLLQRVASTAVAPTSKATGEKRPGFPYIEADRGRINFKFGQEKKPYALTDADFALWQDSENTWGMRLKAQPVRTDFNLSDTGTVSVTGSWQRASSLRQTPVQFNLQWSGAQLGQVTTLLAGNDKGWRGTLNVSATLNGQPADLAVSTQAAVQDFRRYDIIGGGALKLAAQCSSHYKSSEHRLSQLVCIAPVHDGAITLQGNISGIGRTPNYDLALFAQDLPVQSLVEFVRHAKKDIPDDLTATGKVDAKLQMHREPERDPVWQGSGETEGFRLVSKVTDTELNLGRIPFELSAGVPQKLRRHSRERVAPLPSTEGARVSVGPFEMALGRPSPAVVSGWASHSGYDLLVEGDAQVRRALQVARVLGLPSPQLPADGIARIAVHIAGRWQGFAAPQALGRAQLHAVRAELRGVNAPLEIASADLVFKPEQVTVSNISASLGQSRWHGSLNIPRPCGVKETCPIHFELHSDELSTDELNRLLNPNLEKRPWYRFLSFSSKKHPFLSTLQASGTISAGRLLVRKLIASRVSAHADLNAGKVRISDLRAEVLGGQHTGEWKADFNGKTPEYSGTGTLRHVTLAKLAQLMHDGWITGDANGSYRVSASGFTAGDLLSSANATLDIEARSGVLPHVLLPTVATPVHLRRLQAQLLLQHGKFQIQQCKLETPAGIYRVSGTASLDRHLDLKLLREGARGFAITGTLAEPQVTTSPETHAELRP